MSAHATHDKLLDLLYGELPPEEASALRAEIAANPELRAAFEELRATRERIAQHTSLPARVPSALTERILEDARTHAPSSTRSAPDPRHSLWRRAWQSPGFRHSLVAAALLVGVAGILRSLQLDTAPRSHDPLAEHGMAAPVSFNSSNQTPRALTDHEALPPSEEETSSEAAQPELAESTDDTEAAIPPISPRRSLPVEAPPAQKRSAPIVTTDQPPARASEPLRSPTPAAKAEARPPSSSAGASRADSPTTSTAPSRQRSTAAPRRPASLAETESAPMDLGRASGRGSIGASAPASRELAADAFAQPEDHLHDAPSLNRAAAPAPASGAGNVRAEADLSASEDARAPSPSALHRARQARDSNDPATTLTHATEALSAVRDPRTRAEAYTLIAWAYEQLGNTQAARNARKQADALLRELDESH